MKGFARAPLAAAAAAILLLPSMAEADELMDRLKKLETDYVELLIRDREKSQELDRLRKEVLRLQSGNRDPLPVRQRRSVQAPETSAHDQTHSGHQLDDTDDHGHDHGHAGEGGHARTDVLVEGGGIRVYTPSVALDVAGYLDNSGRDLERRLESLRGFGHSHEEGDDHGHALLREGFNLRHAEVGIAAEVIDYGLAQVLISATEDGVEAEEAFFRSVPVGGIAAFKLGLFRSDFGFFNRHHSPEWMFADAPLVHLLTFGDHGLEGVGAGVEITVPGVPVAFGFEAFQGDGEAIFAREGEVGDVDEPSVFVGWAKDTVLDDGVNRLQLGLAGGFGKHQEIHEDGDPPEEEFVQGDAWFVSPGFSFTRRGEGRHGHGDLRIAGEYVYRMKDLEIVDEAESVRSEQDGYHISALYGFAPRFDAGLRWEQVGLTNDGREGDERESFDDSWRLAGVLGFSPNDWSRISLQAGYGSYDFEGGREDVFQAMARFTLQLGPHFH